MLIYDEIDLEDTRLIQNEKLGYKKYGIFSHRLNGKQC